MHSYTAAPSRVLYSSNSSLLRDDDRAVSHVTGVQLVHGRRDALLSHWELLDDRLDLVQSGEVKHALVDVTRGDNGEDDANAVEERRHVRDGKVAAGDREGVDDGVRRQSRDDKIPLRLGGGGDEQAVNWPRDLELLGALGGDELVCAELHGFLLLAVRAREDDDFAAHLGGVLDGQVAQPTDTHDTNRLVRLRAVLVQGAEDGRTTTLQRRGMLIAEPIRDREEEGLTPNTVRGHGALVEVGHTVHGALRAEGLVATQTLLAVLARVVFVAPAYTVALLHVLGLRADGLDDTNTLVSQTHVLVAVVQVGAAEAGGGDLDEDVVSGELWPLSLGLLDGAILGALVYGEGRHCSWW